MLRMKHNQFRITKDGKAGKNNDRVIIPPFEVFSSPTIKIDEVKRRRFNLIDRSVQKARQQIMSRTDDAIFRALDKLEEKK
jgi:hypothetical protein